MGRFPADVLPRRHVFDFNQALMDFGATVCTARNPKCLLLPAREHLSVAAWRKSACGPREMTLTVVAAVVERGGLLVT